VPTGSRPTGRQAGGERGERLADCPACGASFEQPDDPGRKRVYCSRACQQAAYRTRQRTSNGQRRGGAGQRQGGAGQGRQQRQGRDEQRWQHANQQQAGAGQRQQWRHNEHTRQRQPPPPGANGQRPGATGSDRERYRRIIAALLRKAASTPYPHEAAACRAKAEALRHKYRL
jgi:hypothetical protein